jgi:tetraacyldisaccharide 4'-kinase
MDVSPSSGPVAAFCGIARPEQFFAGLESAGLNLATRVAFADHHRYTSRELTDLVSRARAARATALLTTQKDHVRLGSFSLDLPLKTVRLSIAIDHADEALDGLTSQLSPPPASHSL